MIDFPPEPTYRDVTLDGHLTVFFVITSKNRLLTFFYLAWPKLCLVWFFLLGPLPFRNYEKPGGYHLFMGFIERLGTLRFRQWHGPSELSATLEFSIIRGVLLRRFLIEPSYCRTFGVIFCVTFSLLLYFPHLVRESFTFCT